MVKRAALAVITVGAVAGVAFGLLLPMNVDEFLHLAPCACLVEVISVEELTPELLASLEVPEDERTGLNRRAELQVEKWLGKDCEAGSASEMLLVSTEVHSSHPEAGDRYIVFPRPLGEAWGEAVYGRSLWKVTADGEVVVDWRNEFLLAPLELRSGEFALVPLAAVERLLAPP